MRDMKTQNLKELTYRTNRPREVDTSVPFSKHLRKPSATIFSNYPFFFVIDQGKQKEFHTVIIFHFPRILLIELDK
jgi:hypothetical protein